MTRSRDVALYFGGQVLQQGITFLVGVAVARSLGPENYGILSLTRNVYAVALIVGPLGLDTALLKHLGERSDRQAEAFENVRSARIIAAAFNVGVVILLGVFGGQWLERHIYPHPHFGWYLALAMLALPFAADTNVLTGVFRGRHKPVAQIVVSLYVQPLVRAVATVALLWLGFGLPGVIVATAIAAVVSSGTLSYLLIVSLRREKVVVPRLSIGSIRGARPLMGYSSWIAAMVLAYSLMRNIDVLVLGKFRPPKEVGEYAAMSIIAQVIQIYPQALSQTLGASIAGLHAVGDFRGIGSQLDRYLRHASLLAAPLLGGIAAFGPWLSLVFGPRFQFGAWTSFSLSLAYYVSAVLGPLGYSLSMTGQHKKELTILVAGTALTFVSCAIVAGPFGSVGVAMAMAVGYFLINAVRAGIVAGTLGYVPGRLRDFAPPLLCLLIAAACKGGVELTAGRTISGAVIGVASYGLLLAPLYWFMIMSASERQFIWKHLVLVTRKVPKP